MADFKKRVVPVLSGVQAKAEELERLRDRLATTENHLATTQTDIEACRKREQEDERLAESMLEVMERCQKRLTRLEEENRDLTTKNAEKEVEVKKYKGLLLQRINIVCCLCVVALSLS